MVFIDDLYLNVLASQVFKSFRGFSRSEKVDVTSLDVLDSLFIDGIVAAVARGVIRIL
jgi:hypothetical protein